MQVQLDKSIAASINREKSLFSTLLRLRMTTLMLLQTSLRLHRLLRSFLLLLLLKIMLQVLRRRLSLFRKLVSSLILPRKSSRCETMKSSDIRLRRKSQIIKKSIRENMKTSSSKNVNVSARWKNTIENSKKRSSEKLLKLNCSSKRWTSDRKSLRSRVIKSLKSKVSRLKT